MKIEIHVLQNFAPSNLNRDEIGAPKSCEFGGHRRARISSQCQKRAAREMFRIEGLVAEDALGVRTKRLAHEVADELEREHDYPREKGAALALGALAGVGIGRNEKGSGEDGWKTDVLLFVPRRVVRALADLLWRNREELEALVPQAPESAEGGEGEGAEQDKKSKRKSKKDAKKAAKSAYPAAIRKEVWALIDDARSAPDIALYGRMMAHEPRWNVEGACQVAHAISTNVVQMDFDFFTAMDDLRPEGTTNSEMMGTVQFNSSCFYRSASIDVDLLRDNLGAEGEHLLREAVEAAVRAFVESRPSGKQNSMAAHNPPNYVLLVVREKGQVCSLVNAFRKPARAGDPRNPNAPDLVEDSVEKLESRLDRNRKDFWADAAVVATWADFDLEAKVGWERISRLADLYLRAADRATGTGGADPAVETEAPDRELGETA